MIFFRHPAITATKSRGENKDKSMRTPVVGIIILVLALAVVILIWQRDKKDVAVQSIEATMQEIKVTSSAFQHNGMIPEKFTCDGEDMSPPLEISGVPQGMKSLALIMHDPNAPREGGWTHWVKFNMMMNNELGIMNIEEGEEPEGVAGKGTGGNLVYMGPCPPSGAHRYVWSAYALDTKLSLKEGSTKTELESIMQGHILAKGELIGLYSRTK